MAEPPRTLGDLLDVLTNTSFGALRWSHDELLRVRAWAVAQQPVQPGDAVVIPAEAAAEALADAGFGMAEDIDRSGRGIVAELYLDPHGTWRALVVLNALRDRPDLTPGDDRVQLPVSGLTRAAAVQEVSR